MQCLNEIKKTIESGFDKPIIYIVPEQFSFESEKRIIEVCNKKGIIGTQVLSFKRLAYRIFDEKNINNNPLSDSGKAMLLFLIIANLEKDLYLIKNISKNLGLLNTVSDEISEFKRYNILPDMIKDLDFGNEYLNMKIHDLYLIYSEYENHIGNSYVDSNDNLKVLSEVLKEDKTILSGAKIWIDEFDGFIPQELEIIKQLANRCEITISMIAGDDEFFELNNNNIQKIKSIISESDIETLSLNENKRCNNNELLHLENNIFKMPFLQFNEKTKFVFLNQYKNVYDEIENVAKSIIREIQQSNYSFKNVAILTRDIEKYKKPIKMIFDLYDIPYFFDDKKEFSQEPLISLILALIDIISNNYRYENVFSYLKTGLTNITEEDEIDIIENYILKYDIKGKKWDEEFTIPDPNLEKINSIRERIIAPIKEFQASFEGRKTVKDIIIALFDFLNRINVFKTINEIISKLKQNDDAESLRVAQEYSQVWNILMILFDEMNSVIGDEYVSFEKFKMIFKSGIMCYEISVIPTIKDKIIVGDVERTRNSDVKALFVIGVNDDSFPKVFSSEGFISDKERQVLLEHGLEIAKDTSKLLVQDYFNIYKAFSVPSEKLYISYVNSDLEGKIVRASSLINQIKMIFPNISEITNENDYILKPKASIENTVDSIFNLAVNNEEIDQKSKKIIKWFDENQKQTFNNVISGLDYNNTVQKQDKEIIRLLYGQTMKSSVSKLESYVNCPFSFYLRYGLNIKEREVFKLAVPDIGSFLHEILDIFSKKVLEDSIDLRVLDKNECDKIVSSITDNVLSNFRNNLFSSSGKLKNLSIKLKEQIKKSVWLIVLHIKSGSFNIMGSEVEFGKGKEYPEIVIELDDNNKIELSGKVDRIDIAKTPDGNFIRIIDYKSYNKELKLSNVYYGLQLQLLAYSEAISDDSFKPGGVFYLKLDDPILSLKKRATKEDVENEIVKALRMKGLIISNAKLIEAMDSDFYSQSVGESYESPIISLKRDGKGKLSQMPVISEQDFNSLREYINKLIKEIGNQIMSGDISNEPISKKGVKSPCEYCKYYSACQFDRALGNKERIVDELKEDEILKIINS